MYAPAMTSAVTDALVTLRRRASSLLPILSLTLALVGAAASDSLSARAPAAIAPLPAKLSDTGLYVAGSTTEVRASNLAFTPQYPLWSDGATKRRWIHLPRGTAIDAANANAWDFPRGTKLWKEFSMGRKVETRMIERLADGSWRFATYVWNEQGSEAELVPAAGARVAVASAPRGKYAIPGEADCRACHEGAPAPVLGFGALQLSPARDPLAPHAEPLRGGDIDLRALVARGLVRNLPAPLIENAPRIVASSAMARAALGYLHGNCGHCHNAVETGAGVPVSLNLSHDVTDSAASTARALAAMLDQPSRFRPHGGVANAAASTALVARGDASRSVLAIRMASRNPNTQMPPLGTAIADTEGLALIERWINLDLKEN
jgi:hypothetical protein